MKNSAQRGSVRYIVFKEEDIWYATALEFNIVESDEAPELALFKLFEAITGYVSSFQKIHGARPHALNQNVDPEYEALWDELHKPKESVASPYVVYTYGEKLIS